MIYLGVFSIDDYVAFMVQANDTSGSAANLDSGSFAINFYESDSSSAGAVAAMTTPDTTFNTQLDSKTGLYSAKIQMTAANGFEAGKQYFARVTGTVDSETPAALYTWFVRADGQSDSEVSSRIITGIPNAAPASNGGLPTVDANNRIVGIQGTKNDFDDLNDIAAGEAMTLTGDYDAAKTAAQAGDAMTLTAAYDASKTALQSDSVIYSTYTLAQIMQALDSMACGNFTISGSVLTLKDRSGSTIFTFTVSDTARVRS